MESEGDPPTAAQTPWKLRLALIVTVVIALVCAQQFGVLAQFSDPPQLARTLVALGAWGYIAFVLTYATLQPFGIPGTVFVFAAAFIWPWPVAYALSIVGTMAASVVGFSFARFVARAWVTKIIPARFRKYEAALVRREFTTVFFLRLIFWMPPLLHAFFGISKVRFWTHFWASFLGYLLPLFLMAFFGQKLFDFAKNLPMSAWIEIGVGALVAIVIAIFVRRRIRASRAVTE